MKIWKVPKDKNKRSAYIFDLDGTLAINVSGMDWYHPDRSMLDDKTQQAVRITLNALTRAGHHIILLTARDTKYKKVTLEWLDKECIHYDHLYMRPANNRLPDAEFKEDIYKKRISPYYNVYAIFEDNPSVVEMWRRIGLTCFQMDYRH